MNLNPMAVAPQFQWFFVMLIIMVFVVYIITVAIDRRRTVALSVAGIFGLFMFLIIMALTPTAEQVEAKMGTEASYSEAYTVSPYEATEVFERTAPFEGWVVRRVWPQPEEDGSRNIDVYDQDSGDHGTVNITPDGSMRFNDDDATRVAEEAIAAKVKEAEARTAEPEVYVNGERVECDYAEGAWHCG